MQRVALSSNLCIHLGMSLQNCISVSLYATLLHLLLFSIHLLHHSLSSAPSLTSHTHQPATPQAAGESAQSDGGFSRPSLPQLLSPPPPPLSLSSSSFQTPRAICLATAFSASDAIIQLVCFSGHILIQPDLTKYKCEPGEHGSRQQFHFSNKN